MIISQGTLFEQNYLNLSPKNTEVKLTNGTVEKGINNSLLPASPHVFYEMSLLGLLISCNLYYSKE